MSNPELFVSGLNCCWWDSIDKVAKTPERNGVSLPCCPFCGSVLFQHEPEKWWQGVEQYEAAGHPGYRKFIEWLRGRHFSNIGFARATYDKEHPAP